MKLINLGLGRTVNLESIESIEPNKLSSEEEIAARNAGRAVRTIQGRNDNGAVSFSCTSYKLRTTTGREITILLADHDAIMRELEAAELEAARDPWGRR